MVTNVLLPSEICAANSWCLLARAHTHTRTHNAHTRTLVYLLFLTFSPSLDNKAQNNINIYFKQIGVILACASGGGVDYQKCWSTRSLVGLILRLWVAVTILVFFNA